MPDQFVDVFEFAARSRSSSLPVFLRVPLESIHTTTYAFFDDESHHDIRRVFTPWHSPHTQRQFCGFCGTPLTIWTEYEPREADYIRISLSSMERTSLDLLEELGLLVLDHNQAEEGGRDLTTPRGRDHHNALQTRSVERETQGHPWFEETIKGSELGKVRRRRGGNISADGQAKVEWEIVEIGGDEEGDIVSCTGPVKRKIDSVSGDDDFVMK